MSSENSDITSDSMYVPAHVLGTKVVDPALLMPSTSAEEGVDSKTESITEKEDMACGKEEVSLEVRTENQMDCENLGTVVKGKPRFQLPMSDSEFLETAGNGAIENAESVVQQVEPQAIENENVKKNMLEDSESRVIITNKSSASLNNLLIYESSSEDSSYDDDNVYTSQNKVIDSSSSCGSTELLHKLESDSSSDEGDDDDDDDDDDDEEEEEISISKPCKSGTMKKVENKFGDYVGKDTLPIPDISKLNISVQKKDLVHVGNVSAIVDEFVVVEALPNTPPYNLDTFMFLEDCTFLGSIFDVMGPVGSPIYVVRFKNIFDIVHLGVDIGIKVFVSPNGDHTKFVFLKDLLSVKGSDASWVGDIEVPEEFEDFSDDEKESRRKAGLRGNSRKRNSLERHKNFEQKMNKKNTVNTVCEIARYQSGPSHSRQNYQYLPPPLAVPAFDPRTPPPPIPNFHPFPPYQMPPLNFPPLPDNWTFGPPQPPAL